MSRLIIAIVAGASFLVSCAAGVPSGVDQPQGAADVKQTSSRMHSGDDLRRLSQLWQARTKNRLTGDYPIGPGDLFAIHVAGLDEFKDLTIRVSSSGIISLPYVGSIDVTGMTESGLREEIRRRLQKDILHDPQVTVFAKETFSRQVAVLGAVQKPGLYNLATLSETVLGAISKAGGMRSDAAERILFIPAMPAEPTRAKELAAAISSQIQDSAATAFTFQEMTPIVVPLDNVNRTRNEIYLTMPARPGDVIIVPASGEVVVQGWVPRSASYKITPGLTILGAVAAAGGTQFPAKETSIELLRTDMQGRKISVAANLDAIKRGEEPDIPVQGGDVINVVASGPKLAAYGIYRFFTSIVHVGANFPLR